MTTRQLVLSLNPRLVTAFELVEMNKMQKHLICLQRLSTMTFLIETCEDNKRSSEETAIIKCQYYSCVSEIISVLQAMARIQVSAPHGHFLSKPHGRPAAMLSVMMHHDKYVRIWVNWVPVTLWPTRSHNIVSMIKGRPNHLRLVATALNPELSPIAVDSALLPAELSDAVIDQFSHDWPMLKVCSTICRGWLSRSRFHLFRNLDVDTSNSSHILGLLPLLSSPLTTIPLYVNSITICYSDARISQDMWADELDNLHYLPHSFPFATSLTLFIGSWGLQGGRIRCLLASCKLDISITHLRIRQSCFGSFPALADMISQCSVLQQLSLNAVQYSLFIFEMQSMVDVRNYPQMRGSVVLPFDGLPHPSFGLQTLELDDFWCSHFLDWLVSLKPAPPLHTVRMGDIQPYEIPAIIDFIQHYSSSLDHLELQLDIPSSAKMSDLMSNIYPVGGTRIRSIHFDDHGKFIWDNNQRDI